jgi:thermostable 8-oxoguanine DNA glycosylase
MNTTPNAVDPTKIPEKMTRPQLEWWILFGIAVAGKTAKVTEQKMNDFLGHWNQDVTPFCTVKFYIRQNQLNGQLRRVRLGKYTLLKKAYLAAVQLDLDTLEKAEPNTALAMLMNIPGIGPKTARMILLYGFPHHADIWVPLDTHILHWLRDQGYDAPLGTPTGEKYLYYEECFRKEARSRCKTTREFDTEIWMKYSGNAK